MLRVSTRVLNVHKSLDLPHTFSGLLEFRAIFTSFLSCLFLQNLEIVRPFDSISVARETEAESMCLPPINIFNSR